ncbi:hypothetical protein S245_063651, partial [Arachis hypogaea]
LRKEGRKNEFERHKLQALNQRQKLVKVPSRQQHDGYVTAVNWIKYYFKGILGSVIESHFKEGLVQMEDPISDNNLSQNEEPRRPLRKIRPNEVIKQGARIHIPVPIAEARISKRYDVIPSGTLYPNADEIKYLQRLVIYKACLASNDSAIMVLNKPPKLPVKSLTKFADHFLHSSSDWIHGSSVNKTPS